MNKLKYWTQGHKWMENNEFGVNGLFPFAKLPATSSPSKMFDTKWNRNDGVLQSTLGFMLPLIAEDSLLLYYRQYSMLFLFFVHSNMCFFPSLSLALRHIFQHISVQYITNTVMVTWVHIHHVSHGAVLAQPDWPHSIRQTLTAKSAPLNRPFFFVSFPSVKGSLCVFQ